MSRSKIQTRHLWLWLAGCGRLPSVVADADGLDLAPWQQSASSSGILKISGFMVLTC